MASLMLGEVSTAEHPLTTVHRLRRGARRPSAPRPGAATGGEVSSDAGHLFDGMPQRLNNDENKKAAVAGGEDRIGALPDAILQHLLSFLPSSEAVRTCVLATRWRTLWKSVPALRINIDERYGSAHALNKFVNYLLLHDRTPLHECEINSYYGGNRDEAFRYIELWLRYAISCQVLVLRVHVSDPNKELRLSNVTLVSQHLTRLELYEILCNKR